ncbi:uncharacterized protein LOC116410422 [Xenopus tropicalis]|uniref:Uncharacterized protein LOC116410422 n=1 Tax=Xenopus tropicalis TaxID=8364 RepID=A0A8J1JFX5_XENTR|nr:uncharacterized protein LOC116410422 [Xenopus tropicalis]
MLKNTHSPFKINTTITMSSMYEINKILETSSALDIGFIPTMNSTSRSTNVTQPNSRNSTNSLPSIASLPETITAPNSRFSFANTGVLGPTSFLTKMRSITEDNSASTSSKMTEPINTPGFRISSKTFTFKDENPTNRVSSLQSTSPSSDSNTATQMDGTIEITSENDKLSSSSLSKSSMLKNTHSPFKINATIPMSSTSEINRIPHTSLLDIDIIPTTHSGISRSTKVTLPNSRNSTKSSQSIEPTDSNRFITVDNSALTSSKMTKPTISPDISTSSKTFTFINESLTNRVSSLQSTSPSSDPNNAQKMSGRIETATEIDNIPSSNSKAESSMLQTTHSPFKINTTITMSSMYEINKILETSSALDVGFIPTMNSTSRRSTKVTQPNSRNSSSSIPSIASLPETSTAPNSKFSFANTGVLGPTSFLTKMRSITEDNSASTSSKMTEPTNTPGFHTSSKTFTFRDKNPTNNVSSLQSTSPSSDSKTAPKMDGTIEITSENDNMLSSSSLSEFSKLRITEDSSASTSSKMTEPTITPDSSTSKTFTFIYKSLTSNVSRVQSTSLSSDTNTAPKMDGTTEVTTLHATKSVFESSNLKNISIQSRNSTAVTKSFTREYRTELLTVSSSQNIKSIDINIFPTMGPLQTNPTLFKSATDQSIMMTNPSYPSHTSNISVPDTLSNTAPTQPISSSSKLNTSPMTMTSPGTTSDVGISPTASPASDFTISISPIHEFVRTPSKSFPTTPSLPTTLSKMVSQQTRVLPKTTTSQITKSESSHPGKNSATPAASLPSDITLDADLPTQTSIISAKHTKYKFTASENIPKTTLSTRTSLFVTRVLTNASPLTKENIALTSSKGNILSSTSLLLTPPELVSIYIFGYNLF